MKKMILLFVLLLPIISFNVYARDYDIEIEFVDYNTLSDSEKENIIDEQIDNHIVDTDIEYRLVYKEIEKEETEEETNNTIDNPITSTPYKQVIIISSILILGVILLFKKKKSVYILIFLSLLTVNAETVELGTMVDFTTSEETFNYPAPEIEGYEYVGYLKKEIDYLMFQPSEYSEQRKAYIRKVNNILGYEIDPKQFEYIEIKDSKEVPNNVIASWDVSERQNGSIMAYYIDSDNNGLYELYIGQDGGVNANPDSSNLFGGRTSSFSNVTNIKLDKLLTDKVIYMWGMFWNCNNLQEIDVSTFNTSKVQKMYHMFNGCSSLTELDLSNFDTSNVNQMSNMFKNCTNLTSIDISSFNTSNVYSMDSMFNGCSSLTEIDISHFSTSNVNHMGSMFANCTNLQEIDLSNFDTHIVTNMSLMFSGCRSLQELDVTNFDTSSVTTMSGMFYECSSLQELDLTNFDTSEVTNMASMFNGSSKLTTIYASDKFVTDNVTTSSNMFSRCTELIGGNGTKYTSSIIDKRYARIDMPGLSGYFTRK